MDSNNCAGCAELREELTAVREYLAKIVSKKEDLAKEVRILQSVMRGQEKKIDGLETEDDKK